MNTVTIKLSKYNAGQEDNKKKTQQKQQQQQQQQTNKQKNPRSVQFFCTDQVRTRIYAKRRCDEN